MKNISLIINAILILAVGALYYLHFKAPSVEASGKVSTPNANFVPPSGQIVYINIDSLMSNYQYFT